MKSEFLHFVLFFRFTAASFLGSVDMYLHSQRTGLYVLILKGLEYGSVLFQHSNQIIVAVYGLDARVFKEILI